MITRKKVLALFSGCRKQPLDDHVSHTCCQRYPGNLPDRVKSEAAVTAL